MEAKQKENICHAVETTKGQLKCYSNITLYSTDTHIFNAGTSMYLIEEQTNLSHVTEKLILTQTYIRGQFFLEIPP